MQAHRAETTLSEDGVITLRDIPFRRGESVEVIVLPFSAIAAAGSSRNRAFMAAITTQSSRSTTTKSCQCTPRSH